MKGWSPTHSGMVARERSEHRLVCLLRSIRTSRMSSGSLGEGIEWVLKPDPLTYISSLLPFTIGFLAQTGSFYLMEVQQYRGSSTAAA
jgi:hypothetical protein